MVLVSPASRMAPSAMTFATRLTRQADAAPTSASARFSNSLFPDPFLPRYVYVNMREKGERGSLRVLKLFCKNKLDNELHDRGQRTHGFRLRQSVRFATLADGAG